MFAFLNIDAARVNVEHFAHAMYLCDIELGLARALQSYTGQREIHHLAIRSMAKRHLVPRPTPRRLGLLHGNPVRPPTRVDGEGSGGCIVNSGTASRRCGGRRARRALGVAQEVHVTYGTRNSPVGRWLATTFEATLHAAAAPDATGAWQVVYEESFGEDGHPFYAATGSERSSRPRSGPTVARSRARSTTSAYTPSKSPPCAAPASA